MFCIPKSSLALSLLATCAMPSFASVMVKTPSNGTEVGPRFTLSAAANSCSNQPVSAMGFSLDGSSNTTIVNSHAIDATVTATTGAHTLHVKAWGTGGAACVTDVALTVGATSGTNNGVSVSTPGNDATVPSPISVNADALTCSSQPVAAMGYSLDNGSTTIVHATSMGASVASPAGAHTLHIKAWGNQGAVCVSNVPVQVTPQSTAISSPAPPTAVNPSPATSNGVTVNSPANGATLGTAFNLSATATTCSSQPVSALGYSIDYGNTTIVNATSIDRSITAPSGSHILHVKAWGNRDSSCVANIAVNISPQSTESAPPQNSSPVSANGIVVASPANNATVASPFTLTASATNCSSHAISAMGYSLDNSSNTAIVNSTSVAASVTAQAGAHVLHVKAWGNDGSSCVADIAINVESGVSAPPPSGGGVNISSPATGVSVTSPLNLAAAASTCSSQAVTSIGYAIDNATSTIASGSALNAQLPVPAGTHTVHVTAWGSGGATCTADVAIDVTDPSSPINSLVPSNAVSVSDIQTLGNWKNLHDPGAGGSSSGGMNMVSSPSLSGNARQFNTSFSNSGGELYYITYGDDTTATNFLYDGWVYLTASASNVANLELDMNQVMSNGQTVIYGFQCDGYSGTWDYTENAGSPSQPADRWVHSSSPCNVRNWSQNAWHHVQVSYSRDDSGQVTYHSVWLDGTESSIDATVPSSFALGWAPILLTNFQVDGLGAGSNSLYLDKLTIYRW